MKKYDVPSASLTLEHSYPDCSVAVARVHVDVILENLQAADLEFGSWVHVIGTVKEIKHRKIPNRQDKGGSLQTRDKVTVQAAMLWSAGSFRIDEYERTLEARKAAEKVS